MNPTLPTTSEWLALDNIMAGKTMFYNLLSIQATNQTTTNATVSSAQIAGEVSVAGVQMLSFIILLPFILILLTCFTRNKKPSYMATSAGHVDEQHPKKNYAKNKIILFSLMLPSVIILIALFALRITNMLAFTVDTFVAAEKPLHVRIINGLVYCGWAINDWLLVLQFLFVSYIL